MIIETKVYTCRKCQSEDLVKNGTNASGSKGKVLVWISMNRETWEIIASACGDRTENTCWILWGRVPSAYKEAIVFSGYWSAYQAVIPSEQQRRQHLACFLRKTFSFSKCVKMHEIFLKLFMYHYNTELLPVVG